MAHDDDPAGDFAMRRRAQFRQRDARITEADEALRTAVDKLSEYA